MSEYFDNRAKDWDADDMVRQLSQAIGTCLRENVALHDQMQVMDFGAGTGLISAHVAPRVKGITAVDTSREMLQQLADKPELRGKVETVYQNILDQALARQFDLIISAMAMHHVENTDRLVQTFAEHLKPGGMIALADLDKEDGSFHPEDAAGVFHDGFERAAFQALLEKHGFNEIRFVTTHTVHKETRQYPVFLVIASHA